MIDVVLAVPDLRREPELVSGAAAAGVRVVRRCVDAVDALASGAAAEGAHVVVSAGLPRLTGDLIKRLAIGRLVVGLAEDAADAERLRSMGARPVLLVAKEPAVTMTLLARACESAASGTGREDGVVGVAPSVIAHPGGVWSTGCSAPEGLSGVPAEADGPGQGRLVVVWGPMGAPGRTTVALAVSESLADSGRRVCLVDADTYAPSVTLALGIVEDSSGLVVACRRAELGSLTPSALAVLARPVRERWHVLGGLPRVDRWPDLRPGALNRVWEACREVFDVTVVDVGFCLEDDETPGAWSRGRNVAALTALAEADHVVAVAEGSARGAARLAASWATVAPSVHGTPVTLIRNRAVGSGRQWREAMSGCGVAAPIIDVPHEPKVLDSCWERGRTLRERAPRSKVRRALGDVAHQVMSG